MSSCKLRSFRQFIASHSYLNPTITRAFREDGCVVPCGKPVDTGVSNPSGYTLNYNEYVVYNTNQIRVRYLVEVDFKF